VHLPTLPGVVGAAPECIAIGTPVPRVLLALEPGAGERLSGVRFAPICPRRGSQGVQDSGQSGLGDELSSLAQARGCVTAPASDDMRCSAHGLAETHPPVLAPLGISGAPLHRLEVVRGAGEVSATRPGPPPA